mmetsp:Transcript_271/g.880  ORF Transcript_271/g.880 Transcript_271/m.880 type:complete len:490 (+) Transcript_271:194-1663(+)|eukprot:CAMPEP_0198729166 /NCGR_PEP_ID=MMETSP1475-20131203/15095_1 /TAXON_ID= ORGANISM="Unidentified sp., Strain CCMP1999" /NCGR_SAMPLE_ID=MMETSP1475 /ASSEMBLY_ACC=CAM_ASM_001111 /LENGTH=489 /DNA_ID=CAMNT_0044491739 /DNA_START=186 /DNA_END=1655 /DNA_ORIENTATION=+
MTIFELLALGVGVSVLSLIALITAVLVVPKAFEDHEFPGPKPHSYLLGSLGDCQPGLTLEYFLKLQKEYGNNFRVWLLHRKLIVIADPEDAKFCLITKRLPKYVGAYYSFRGLLGEGLLTTAEEKHNKQRRAIASLFNKDLLRRLHEFVEVEIEKLVEILDSAAAAKKSINIDECFQKFTSDVLGRTIFGTQLNLQSGVDDSFVSKANAALQNVNWIYAFYPLSKLYGRPEKLLNANKLVKGKCVELMEARRREDPLEKANRPTDLLDVLLSNKDASDDYIVDELATFLLAGQETSAHGFSFVVFELAQNEKVAAKVAEEANSVLSSGRNVATYDQVSSLKYADQVWKETLRIRSPAANGTYRIADRDYTLPSGAHLKKGDQIAVVSGLLHHSKDHWKDPDVFDPDRFSEERSRGRHPLAFAPFSSGPRNCIGQFFASHEGVVTLASLCKRYRFELDHDPKKIVNYGDVTLRPSTRKGEPLLVRVHMRE